MRIAVYGAGGVGAYFGGKLAQLGKHEVIFIARGAHLKAIQEKGLKVAWNEGEMLINPCTATDDVTSVGQVDVVLVCVKAWQVLEAAEAMKGTLVGEDTIVVPLQNGMNTPKVLSTVLGQRCVLGGLCKIFSWVEEPGLIKAPTAEAVANLSFGELTNEPTERSQALLQAFRDADVRADIPADITLEMWKKFIGICTLSGMGGITRVPIGVYRATPESWAMLEECVREGCAVARGHTVALPNTMEDMLTGLLHKLDPSFTASMQRDIMDGKPSELDEQIGDMVRLGAEVGVDTPVFEVIYQSLLPTERLARGQLEVSQPATTFT